MNREIVDCVFSSVRGTFEWTLGITDRLAGGLDRLKNGRRDKKVRNKQEIGVIWMNDWFEWNGVRCTEYGIHVSEQPPRTIPEQRVTQLIVPGRSGSLNLLEGDDVYNDLVLTATCFITDPARIPDIAAWLWGSGTVAFANRRGGFYYAWIANQIPFEKILRGNPHCSFAVNFRCFPFWYAEEEARFELTASGQFIENPGTVPAEPVITVLGSGEITLMVDQTIVELDGIEENITIDSTLQEAYTGTSLCNDCMSGDFPLLKPGANAVSWSGDVSKVILTVRWRYL